MVLPQITDFFKFLKISNDEESKKETKKETPVINKAQIEKEADDWVKHCQRMKEITKDIGNFNDLEDDTSDFDLDISE